jgi:hypothetical protein
MGKLAEARNLVKNAALFHFLPAFPVFFRTPLISANYATTTCFHIFSDSTFTNHTVIRRCVNWHLETVVM